ncbi:hypothetical protein cypCar_00033809, partial [Cyprinus carpio]
PPEFIQWPQSVSKPAGGSAVFTCVAQGVPEPHIIWLKNGKILTPGDNVKLTNNNSTLAVTRITSEDEAIYQCIAENSAGTNQASARLAVSLAKELPDAPQGLKATALSKTTLQLSWTQPPAEITDGIIGYVLHICKYGVPSSPTFFTKAINTTAVQVLWELPNKPGKAEGFRLSYRRVPHGEIQGPIQLPCHVNIHTISHLVCVILTFSFCFSQDPGAVYEVKLVAYNGNGESDCSKKLVSLAEDGTSAKTRAGEETQCNCRGVESSVSSIVVGIHIGLACIIFCVLFLMFGYRRRKGTQDSWSVPQGEDGGHPNGIPKAALTQPAQSIELVPQGHNIDRQAQCQVLIEQHSSSLPGTGTGTG